jgi:hypothetical protein
MKTKLFSFTVFVLLLFSVNSVAQETGEDGIRKNLQTSAKEKIFYKYSAYSMNDIHYNHYSIFQKLKNKKADTIYVVDINFDVDKKFIEIIQNDKQNNQSFSKRIDFQPFLYPSEKVDKPIWCVNSYLFNDTLLSLTNNNNSTILFTVVDTIKSEIILHQFTTTDGNFEFELVKFRQSYLKPHLVHARNYWDWYYKSIERIDSTQINKLLEKYKKLKVEFEQEVAKINNGKDSLISIIHEKQNKNKYTEVNAPEKLIDSSNKRIDNIFSDHLGQTHVRDIKVTGNYKLYRFADVNKPNFVSANRTPINLPYSLTKQFAAIDTVLKYLPLENESVTVCTDDPTETLREKHLYRTQELRQEIQSLNFSLDSAGLKLSLNTTFSSALDKADSILRSKCQEKIPITTIYNYNFKYTSKSEWQIWKSFNKRITDNNKTLITNEEMIDYFTSKYPKQKNGKYNVRLNTTILNERYYGPVIDSVSLKYKFITKIGFNAGSFFINEETTEGNISNKYGYQFYNVFLIYHHFGIFGGSITRAQNWLSNIDEIKYSEMGIYLAPGKVFYFKLGLANYQKLNQNPLIMPILGASLIFSVFQIEGGYNFALNYPYAMAGFNIPLNL